MTNAFDRFRAGDRAAADEVIAEFAPIAYAVALGVLRNPARAEAVVVDVVSEALSRPQRSDGDHLAERLWIAGTTRRRALESLRQETRRRRLLGRRAATPNATDDEIWASLMEGLTSEEVCTALESLRPPLREAVSLAYVNGLAPPEIARRTGTSAERARERLREGLLALQDTLTPAIGVPL